MRPANRVRVVRGVDAEVGEAAVVFFADGDDGVAEFVAEDGGAVDWGGGDDAGWVVVSENTAMGVTDWRAYVGTPPRPSVEEENECAEEQSCIVYIPP